MGIYFASHLYMASSNSHSLPSSSPFTYQRHQPEKTTLYKLIQENLLSFYQQIDHDQEKGLPDFIKKEFEAFLKCGLLSHGFLRLQCQSCQQEKLVAFSCKRRGFPAYALDATYCGLGLDCTAASTIL